MTRSRGWKFRCMPLIFNDGSLPSWKNSLEKTMQEACLLISGSQVRALVRPPKKNPCLPRFTGERGRSRAAVCCSAFLLFGYLHPFDTARSSSQNRTLERAEGIGSVRRSKTGPWCRSPHLFRSELNMSGDLDRSALIAAHPVDAGRARHAHNSRRWTARSLERESAAEWRPIPVSY